MPHLVVVYGPLLSGKSSVAREVAASLRQKTALVSVDALLSESIVVPDADSYSELEMVHTQARLLVANYLKNGYHVAVEGAFFYDRSGEIQRHEQEIDQLVALMRNLAHSPLLVRLTASEATMRRRAEAAGRLGSLETALRIDASYKPRYGERCLRLETDEASVSEIAGHVLQHLEAEEFA